MQSNITSSLDMSGPQGAMITPNELSPDAHSLLLLTDYVKAVNDVDRGVITAQNYTKELDRCKTGALVFIQARRYSEALHAYHNLYLLHLDIQKVVQSRIHKGDVLYWLGFVSEQMGCHSVALRYYLLALCEDAIESKGTIVPSEVGTYHKLVIGYGFTPKWFHDLALEIYEAYKGDRYNVFPEHMLVGVNSAVRVFQPVGYEFQIVAQSPHYLTQLIEDLGGGGSNGKAMERIASYLLSTIPGFHVTERIPSNSTDYDVLAEVPMEASRLYPYTGDVIVCECKDTQDATGFTSIAKLCRVLDSVKARAGIVFSRNGVSGVRNTLDAHREIVKVYQDRGILIVVVDVNDLRAIAGGESFYSVIVEKFRRLRLDLPAK